MRCSLVSVGLGRRCGAFGALAFLDVELEKFRELFDREAKRIVGCAAVIVGH